MESRGHHTHEEVQITDLKWVTLNLKHLWGITLRKRSETVLQPHTVHIFTAKTLKPLIILLEYNVLQGKLQTPPPKHYCSRIIHIQPGMPRGELMDASAFWTPWAISWQFLSDLVEYIVLPGGAIDIKKCCTSEECTWSAAVWVGPSASGDQQINCFAPWQPLFTVSNASWKDFITVWLYFLALCRLLFSKLK